MGAHDIGGGGAGATRSLEYYTDETANAYQSGGSLVIVADHATGSTPPCWYGACEYTSGRLNTEGKFAQAYGRFEARIQIPSGQGLWPAFWLLGDNVEQVGWPACGKKVDIAMENAGSKPDVARGSLHEPGGQPLTATFSSPTSLADGFHTYAIDWAPGAIWFYVDDQLYETQASETQASTWPFDHPLLHRPEPGGRRDVRGSAGCHDGVPADHEGGLGTRPLGADQELDGELRVVALDDRG